MSILPKEESVLIKNAKQKITTKENTSSIKIDLALRSFILPYANKVNMIAIEVLIAKDLLKNNVEINNIKINTVKFTVKPNSL